MLTKHTLLKQSSDVIINEIKYIEKKHVATIWYVIVYWAHFNQGENGIIAKDTGGSFAYWLHS